MQVISLSAHMPRSGKDFVFEAIKPLLEAEGYTVHRFAFGDALKDATAFAVAEDRRAKLIRHWFDENKDQAFISLSIDSIKDSDYKEFLRDKGLNPYEPRTPRFHLWNYGTFYVRDYLGHQTAWVDIIKDQIKSVAGDKVVVFVTDTRQINEIAMLKEEFGATTVRIHPTSFPEDHVSQADIMAFRMNPVENALLHYKFNMEVLNVFNDPEAAALHIKLAIL